MFQHSTFNAGVAPASLIPKKIMAFKCKDNQLKQVMKALLQQTEFSSLWVVAVKGSKIMPVGVGLTVQQQILVTKGERYAPID